MHLACRVIGQRYWHQSGKPAARPEGRSKRRKHTLGQLGGGGLSGRGVRRMTRVAARRLASATSAGAGAQRLGNEWPPSSL